MTSSAQQTNTVTQFNLPMRALENAQPLLRNPDRGLRMETYITLGEALESYPGNVENPYEKLLGFIEKYEEESPVIVQLYVYLTRYNEKPLDSIAFSQLQRMLELCQDNNIRILLRFAYQNEANPDAAWPQVKEHLNQIGEWFKAHNQLIEDTLYVMQSGIVGYWGEGHSYKNFNIKHTGPAFDLLCSIIPSDVFFQVRNINQITQLSDKYKDRVGIHDDYIIGEKNGEWSFFLGREDEQTKRLEQEFRRTINDGELPWGHATYYDKVDGYPLDSMDAISIFQQLKQYSMTSLSLEHNYREGASSRLFTMARWKDEYLSQAQLEEAGLPYHPSLLDEKGNINTFAYIQYHLGYLLSITSLELNEASCQVRFTIQNNGFAAPLNFNALSLVIHDKEYFVDSYDKYALGSMQAVTYTVDLPEEFDSSKAILVQLARRMGSPLRARFMNKVALCTSQLETGFIWL